MPDLTTPPDIQVTPAGAAGRTATGLFLVDGPNGAGELELADGSSLFGHYLTTQGAVARDAQGVIL